MTIVKFSLKLPTRNAVQQAYKPGRLRETTMLPIQSCHTMIIFLSNNNILADCSTVASCYTQQYEYGWYSYMTQWHCVELLCTRENQKVTVSNNINQRRSTQFPCYSCWSSPCHSSFRRCFHHQFESQTGLRWNRGYISIPSQRWCWHNLEVGCTRGSSPEGNNSNALTSVEIS